MARPSLFTHRKLRTLTRLIGCKARAIGSLELIWHAGYQDGDSRLGNSDDVESAAEWRGTKGKLTLSLCAAGFIDDLGDGTYAIHELLDHAPDYVRKRRSREAERRTLTGQRPVTDQAVSSTPAPAPIPLPSRSHPAQKNKRGLRPSDACPGFAAAWTAFPHFEHRSKRAKSLAIWNKRKLEPKADRVLAEIEQRVASTDWTKNGGEFVPGMQVWLKDVDPDAPPLPTLQPAVPLNKVSRAAFETVQFFRDQEKRT